MEQGLAELLKRLWPEALLALPDDVVSIGFWVLVAGFALLTLVVMVKDGPRYRREAKSLTPEVRAALLRDALEPRADGASASPPQGEDDVLQWLHERAASASESDR